MKVIIAGGRDFKDYETLKMECDWALRYITTPIEIVSGGQVTIEKDEQGKPTGKKWGADYLGEQYAKERGYPLKRFDADWDKHGKSAGPIRNEEMAQYAEGLMAFWDGKSKGTRSMITRAHKHKLKVRIHTYTSTP